MLCALNAHVQKCRRVIKSSLKLSDLNTELMENYKFGKVVTG